MSTKHFLFYAFALLLIIMNGCGEAFDADNTITVRGTIIDQSTNQPVGDARVAITDPPEFKQSTQTDSTGSYLFTIESEDPVNLSIEASKASFGTISQSLSAKPGTDLTNVDITLAADTTGNGDDGSGGDGGDDGSDEGTSGPGAAAIMLAGSPPQAINIAQTGESVQAPITFQVQDSAGNPLSEQKAVEVQFKLLSSPGGQEKLVPQTATTNADGQVTTTLYSGNKAGEVKLQAVIDKSELGFLMKSSPTTVAIHGGNPDLSHFSIAREQKNIEGFTIDNVTVPISVILGDEFSNPVKPGTIVYFESTGGIIQGSGRTDENGKLSVELTSAEPRPSDGRVTVTASTVNKNNERIQKKTDVIFSTSKAKVNTSPKTFELRAKQTKTISYTVTDLHGNPMAPGTQISVKGDEGISLTGDTDIALKDFLKSGNGSTDFSFTVEDDGTTEKENIDISITVTSPSGQTTTFDELSGTRIIEGSEQVGAAAIVLTAEPQGSININETGDDVSAPLTFQVQDSLGRPLTGENAVEVEFSIINGPGGAEDLVPAKATTDGSGNVTTTLFSGNKAGEVKVEAVVRRPEVGLTVRSSPILIAIHGGFPDQNHFTLSSKVINFEALNTVGVENEISVLVGDKFSNPVKPGTVIYFSSTGGVIEGSAKTDELGRAKVRLQSGNPYPTSGIGTVTASTKDQIGNTVGSDLDIIFSGSRATITAQARNTASDTTDFIIPNGGSETFDYTVTDTNGFAMAVGTQISVDAGQDVDLTGQTNFAVGNYETTNGGPKNFSFTVRDTDTENNVPSDLTIQISVTTPQGQVSTYNIQGTRN